LLIDRHFPSLSEALSHFNAHLHRFGQFGVIQKFRMRFKNRRFNAQPFTHHLLMKFSKLRFGTLHRLSKVKLVFSGKRINVIEINFNLMEMEYGAYCDSWRSANSLDDARHGRFNHLRNNY